VSKYLTNRFTLNLNILLLWLEWDTRRFADEMQDYYADKGEHWSQSYEASRRKAHRLRTGHTRPTLDEVEALGELVGIPPGTIAFSDWEEMADVLTSQHPNRALRLIEFHRQALEFILFESLPTRK